MLTEYRAGSASGPLWSAAWGSHRGRDRAHNQDRAAVGATFAVVADGVGSSPDGAGAASAAVAAFATAVAGSRTPSDVAAAVAAAHDDLLDRQRDGRLADGSATTLVAAVAVEDGVVVAHVGDSRAWSIGPHGVVAVGRPLRRWDPGAGRYVLHTALGVGEGCEAETTLLPWDDVRTVVLASDGLLGPDDEPPDLVALVTPDADRPEQACRRLVDHARPATDDVTVAVVRALRPAGPLLANGTDPRGRT